MLRESSSSSTATSAPQAAPQTADARWQATFDAMLDPVALMDADGTVEQCNRAFAAFLDQDAQMLLGQKCHRLIHHCEDHIPGCPLVRSRHSGVRETMELAVGEQVFLVVTDPVKAPNGVLTGFVHIMRDITERKRTEAALQESVERYQTIARNLPNGIIHILDRDFHYLYNEGEELRRVGLTHEMLVGKTIFEVLGQASAEKVASQCRRVLNGETVRFEGDFGDQAFQVHAAPLRDASGQVEQILVLSINVTERKRVEDKLLSALEAINDGIWEWNPKTGAVYWSPRSFTMLGYAPDEFPMDFNSWSDLLHPDDRPIAWADMQRQINTRDKSFSIEFRYKRKDGSWAWINGRGKTMALDAQGGITRVIGTHTDITARKHAEAQLAEQLGELRRWHNATLGREERILDLKREVNALLAQTGQPPRYASAEGAAHG